MKTTISIPGPLVQEVDLVATQLGITNDELCIRAIEAFLQLVIVQADKFTRSQLRTVLVATISSNLRLADIPY